MPEPSLTVEQEHLLKRELLRLQISKETNDLDNLTNIDLIGPPFVNKKGLFEDGSRLPVLRFVFKNFLETFPIFGKANQDIWVTQFQPFLQGLAAKDISSSADRDEATKRRRIARGFKRIILMMLVAGLGTNRAKDPTGRYKLAPRYAAQKQNEADAVPFEGDPAALGGAGPNNVADPENAALPVNMGPRAAVIGVRRVAASGIFRSRQTEYIVEAQFWGAPPVWVARTYSDFTALNKKLIREFPGKALAHVPSKHSSDVTVLLKGEEVTLVRERQRTTLRYYLFKLCALPKVASSEPFLEFLFKDRLGELSAEEVKDIEARIALDKSRWENRTKFEELAAERSQKLEKYLKEIKMEILREDALPRLFMELKTKDRVEDMSPLVQKLVEYCLIEVAAMIYHLLIARDDSPEVYGQLRRMHKLMPYMMMQGILKLSNPALIFKKMTDLFMAQPFGSKSLLQTMFIRILNDDMRSQSKLILELKEFIADDDIFNTLHAYTWSDHYARQAVGEASDLSGHDLVLAVFESSPAAQAKTTLKVRAWHDAWQKAVRGQLPDDSPEVERYSQLKDLLKLMVRHRDKEILSQFWAEPMTMQFIRALVNMTYDVLIEMFRVGGLSESVGDLERFMSDLVKMIDHMDGGMALDANEMVEELIQLLRRHQNALFRFINRVYRKDDSFFVHIISWMTRSVNFVRNGKEGKNNMDLLGLVDKAAADKVVDLATLQSDLDKLDSWLLLRKATQPKTAGAVDEEMDGKQSGAFDVTDIGLNWDDVEFGLAEVERDEQEEFLPTLNEDLNQDAVAREKLRLDRLAEIEKRKKQLPPRPVSRAIDDLLPRFSSLLGKVLATADAAPSELDPTKEKTAS